MSKTESQAQAILALLRKNPQTCDELENLLDIPHQTVSARCTGLRRKGLIWNTGKSRLTRSGVAAIVWGATDETVHHTMDTSITATPKPKRVRGKTVETTIVLRYRGHVVHIMPYNTAENQDFQTYGASFSLSNRLSHTHNYAVHSADAALIRAMDHVVENSTGNQKPWFPILELSAKLAGPKVGLTKPDQKYFIGLEIETLIPALQTLNSNSGLIWVEVKLPERYITQANDLLPAFIPEVCKPWQESLTFLQAQNIPLSAAEIDDILEDMIEDVWDRHNV